MDFGLKKKIKTIQPDKSDFSTQKKKPDTSDFANKQKPKKIDTSKIKNTFESDAGVKPRVTTFTADTNAAKSTNKDRSDFAGGNKNKNETKLNGNKTKTDGNKTKTKVVTPAMIKAKGFTSLRDYLNNERGLKRTDGKKVGKQTSSSMPKPPPKAPNRAKNKIVYSSKNSSAGIDGGSSQVNRAKKKPKKDVMSTKTPKTYRNTNITPTKLQRDRMRKRSIGST
jgi:hypothetical protein